MRRRALALLAALMAAPTLAQLPEDHFKPAPPTPAVPDLRPAIRPPSTTQPGDVAVLRGLDKMTGKITTFEVRVGDVARYARLVINVGACRMPEPGAPPDAYVWLTVRDEREVGVAFAGWMIASSPALSALDHPRYDVWVLHCRMTAGDASGGSAQN